MLCDRFHLVDDTVYFIPGLLSVLTDSDLMNLTLGLIDLTQSTFFACWMIM